MTVTLRMIRGPSERTVERVQASGAAEIDDDNIAMLAPPTPQKPHRTVGVGASRTARRDHPHRIPRRRCTGRRQNHHPKRDRSTAAPHAHSCWFSFSVRGLSRRESTSGTVATSRSYLPICLRVPARPFAHEMPIWAAAGRRVSSVADRHRSPSDESPSQSR